MASALNMDEGSDTTSQIDSMEKREEEEGKRRGGKETGGQIDKVEPQVAVIYQ